ncbi:MAG: protein kinase [Gemmataceae bacterium]|nr:protein kinase [Gemmataceae bacterium]
MRLSTTDTLLADLLGSSIILDEEWQGLSDDRRRDLANCRERRALLDELVAERLLSRYQATQISAGRIFSLVLGNYRVLDRLGSGGMGVVLKAEHLRMRRLVAIKVMTLPAGYRDDQMLARFYAEMRSVAQLQHPNIVAAIDAGESVGQDPDSPVQHYFVMEYVPGEDLETHVAVHGTLSPEHACDIAYQVASALDEANKHELVHRDIKPSNILVTPDHQAKLLDFGLARHFHHRVTEPGTVLGTPDYLAPEQARDASTVDIRADVFGLGGTLFWCLTGRTPFVPQPSITLDLAVRLTQSAPSVRSVRPDVPPELDVVVSRMMALKPENRYATPQAVMRALLPFLPRYDRSERSWPALSHGSPTSLATAKEASASTSRVSRVLIVDDEPDVCTLARYLLEGHELECEQAGNGHVALELLRSKPFDLVLLDIDMPAMSGIEVVRRLRESPPSPNLKIIMFSGRVTGDEMAQLLLAGANDFVTKPFSPIQLLARVKAALQFKDAQDRSDEMTRQLGRMNAELERNVSARDSDLVDARNALVLALAKLVEYRQTETSAHLTRIQRFAKTMAEEAAQAPHFAAHINRDFVQLLECCAPLHDIGTVALPDHILLKPGRLTAEERLLMQAHTTIGADTLQEVARQHGSAMAFLQMAIDIARHHHERFDGSGYPDRLTGDTIPLAARIVTVADVYDALRSRRIYKPPLSHAAAVQIMTEASQGQFDPALLEVLPRCASRWEAIFRENGD